jgi:DNA (cytosine-5)-methyltransferase 1
MTAIIITAVGQQRGAPRIWMEGRKLEREGFGPGARYRVETTRADALILVKSGSGPRAVSSRKSRGYTKPIIDISNRDLFQWFGENQKLRIAIRRGRITIRRHRISDRSADRVGRLLSKLRQKQPLDIHSLFHGGGIIDKAVHSGLARAGVSSFVQVAVERDCQYLDISIDRNPELFTNETIFIEANIQDVCLDNPPKSDVLVVGVPCTGASISGMAKNALKHAEDHLEAGALFIYFLNWVQATDPALIILENVKQYSGTASMSAIRSVLSSLGYNLQERVINGNEFGALEDRDRFCLVAMTEGLECSFNLNAVNPLYSKPSSLADVLEPIPLDSPTWKSYDYLNSKAKRDKENGKGFRRQLFSGTDTRISTITRRYFKGGTTDPFIRHPQNPNLSRKVTRIEHARMKGIPETYIDTATISETVAHEIMGQAVVPLAFEAVAADLGAGLVEADQSPQGVAA